MRLRLWRGTANSQIDFDTPKPVASGTFSKFPNGPNPPKLKLCLDVASVTQIACIFRKTTVLRSTGVFPATRKVVGTGTTGKSWRTVIEGSKQARKSQVRTGPRLSGLAGINKSEAPAKAFSKSWNDLRLRFRLVIDSPAGHGFIKIVVSES
jgi:hypothetical protein